MEITSNPVACRWRLAAGENCGPCKMNSCERGQAQFRSGLRILLGGCSASLSGGTNLVRVEGEISSTSDGRFPQISHDGGGSILEGEF